MKRSMPSDEFYQKNCVHTGGHQVDSTPKVISMDQSGLLEIEVSEVKDNVARNLGPAGIVPLYNDKPCFDSVPFDGESHSIAWIRYFHKEAQSQEPELDLAKRDTTRTRQHLVGVVGRRLYTIGILQETGMCCCSFSVLVFREPDHKMLFHNPSNCSIK